MSEEKKEQHSGIFQKAKKSPPQEPFRTTFEPREIAWDVKTPPPPEPKIKATPKEKKE